MTAFEVFAHFTLQFVNLSTLLHHRATDYGFNMIQAKFKLAKFCLSTPVVIVLAPAPSIGHCCRRDPQFTSMIELLVLAQAILPSIISSPIVVGASYCKIHFGGNLKSLLVALIRV
jgi:hypothetical protein